MVVRRLVLASASPRRRDLLQREGFEFTVDPADIDESIGGDEDPLVATCRLATQKAAVVAGRSSTGEVVLAADTTVFCDGELYGKPVDSKDACRQLTNLAGRNHEVITAWAIISVGPQHAGQGVGGFSRSVVRMRELSRSEIAEYVQSQEPDDKAGGYAIQGLGRSLVGAVVGSVDNVIGLPVSQVVRQLQAIGISPGIAGRDSDPE